MYRKLATATLCALALAMTLTPTVTADYMDGQGWIEACAGETNVVDRGLCAGSGKPHEHCDHGSNGLYYCVHVNDV